MASKIIGRAACPECGFDSAHIKESDKCVYRYCPECGSQTHARTTRQKTNMLERMRPVADATATPTAPVATVPTGTEPTATGSGAAAAPATPAFTPKPGTVKAAPPPVAKRRGLFG
ncbi:MAG TPA: hypothetical protein VNU71_14665 [Burkholderiaceae bacterium]|nr:hypothetical protein [Burkholderiaceae bacterium]